MKLQIMKKHLLLLLGISLLSLHPALAQDSGPITALAPPFRRGVKEDSNLLPRFDLDFPGGTPRDLVKAIEKATAKPVNAIIPDDCSKLIIPGILVKNVTVAQLFEAVTLASKVTFPTVSVNYGTPGHYPIITGPSFVSSYGFRTQGTPDENSIWYFYWEKPASQPLYCRFYQLSPYLEAGYKVEDITTAIETAWKMIGAYPQPEIKYHKDTKMLIAVGELDKLQMIDDALKELPKGSPKQKSSNGSGPERSERPKTQ
jgi:hypothetical protein